MSTSSLFTSITETISVMFNTPFVPPAQETKRDIAVQLMEMPPSRTPSGGSKAIPIASGATLSPVGLDTAGSPFSNSSAGSSPAVAHALHDTQAVLDACMHMNASDH